MKYVRPPVHTVALGQAFGAAAMLLSQGKRGQRYALPNPTILLNQPRSMARGQATDIAIKAKEVAHNRKQTCKLIAQACGKNVATVMEDCSRVKYLQPQEAVEYGLIDKVIEHETLAVKPAFMSTL
jgi:ATP-dependent Clp protease protease subunit